MPGMDLRSMTWAESRCVLLCHADGIFRLKIPDDHKQLKSEEVELVWEDIYSIKIIIESTGMFNDGGVVYLVGGHNFTWSTRFNKRKVHAYYPSADQSTAMTSFKTTNKYKPMVKPTVFRVKEQTYLFSLYVAYDMPRPVISFQSFDPTNRSFQALKTPNLSLDNLSCSFTMGHFIVFDYIYLFIEQSKYNNPTPYEFAFSFDTSSKKWKKLDSLCSKFVKQRIPFPYGHNGDTGISAAFSGNVRILVALVYGRPTAYRVSLDERGGSLRVKSHRLLVDHYSTLQGRGGTFKDNFLSYLIGLGDGKFCAVYSSPEAPLLAYIFKMDFTLEYEQNYSKSVVVLSSKKFKLNVPAFIVDRPSSACLAFISAPPTSLENVQVDHSMQPDEPVKMEEEKEDDKGVVYINGEAYVKAAIVANRPSAFLAMQPDEPVKMEEEKEDDNGVVYVNGVAYVKDFNARDFAEMKVEELF